MDPAYDDRTVLQVASTLRAGDWRPAAALLHDSARDPDRKAHRVDRLGFDKRCHSAIEAWVSAQPGNPDAHLVRARALVVQAWAARGNSYAKQVSKKAWPVFFDRLRAADAAVSGAVGLAPDDPTPWAMAVMIARALELPRAEFQHRWDGLLARDPQHVSGHYHALQYLCAKWSGSHEEMFDFADRVSASAPLASPLHMLPVFAVTEYALAIVSRRVPEGPRIGRYKKSKQVKDAVARAVECWETPAAERRTPPHARAVFDRTHLAFWAYMSRSPAVAARQYRLMGPYSSELPWSYFVPAYRVRIPIHRLAYKVLHHG
ncbi:hypothetical protein [Actinomadura sp. NPDC048394]|uniref:hypothetical protein n=1 Tax=Actinomadura sp. NPDC048394 TaxID=3158223 RepID=UPI0033C5EA80